MEKSTEKQLQKPERDKKSRTPIRFKKRSEAIPLSDSRSKRSGRRRNSFDSSVRDDSEDFFADDESINYLQNKLSKLIIVLVGLFWLTGIIYVLNVGWKNKATTTTVADNDMTTATESKPATLDEAYEQVSNQLKVADDLISMSHNRDALARGTEMKLSSLFRWNVLDLSSDRIDDAMHSQLVRATRKYIGNKSESIKHQAEKGLLLLQIKEYIASPEREYWEALAKRFDTLLLVDSDSQIASRNYMLLADAVAKSGLFDESQQLYQAINSRLSDHSDSALAYIGTAAADKLKSVRPPDQLVAMNTGKEQEPAAGDSTRMSSRDVSPEKSRTFEEGSDDFTVRQDESIDDISSSIATTNVGTSTSDSHPFKPGPQTNTTTPEIGQANVGRDKSAGQPDLAVSSEPSSTELVGQPELAGMTGAGDTVAVDGTEPTTDSKLSPLQPNDIAGTDVADDSGKVSDLEATSDLEKKLAAAFESLSPGMVEPAAEPQFQADSPNVEPAPFSSDIVTDRQTIDFTSSQNSMEMDASSADELEVRTPEPFHGDLELAGTSSMTDHLIEDAVVGDLARSERELGPKPSRDILDPPLLDEETGKPSVVRPAVRNRQIETERSEVTPAVDKLESNRIPSGFSIVSKEHSPDLELEREHGLDGSGSVELAISRRSNRAELSSADDQLIVDSLRSSSDLAPAPKKAPEATLSTTDADDRIPEVVDSKRIENGPSETLRVESVPSRGVLETRRRPAESGIDKVVTLDVESMHNDGNEEPGTADLATEMPKDPAFDDTMFAESGRSEIELSPKTRNKLEIAIPELATENQDARLGNNDTIATDSDRPDSAPSAAEMDALRDPTESSISKADPVVVDSDRDSALPEQSSAELRMADAESAENSPPDTGPAIDSKRSDSDLSPESNKKLEVPLPKTEAKKIAPDNRTSDRAVRSEGNDTVPQKLEEFQQRIRNEIRTQSVSTSTLNAAVDFTDELVETNSIASARILLDEISNAVYLVRDSSQRSNVRDKYYSTRKRIDSFGRPFAVKGLYEMKWKRGRIEPGPKGTETGRFLVA